MTWLSDEALDRLRASAGAPDLTGTRYRLVQRIGRGGMGVVYAAEDVTLARRVALKVLDRPDPHGHLASRLIREAHILARLEHPGIVPVHDVGTLPDGRFFYTMKLVRGDRLDHHLRKGDSTQEHLRLFVRICDAVAFAHAHGVLHRDLKPENIMVGPFGEVLVMDWGVAKILRDVPKSSGATDSSTVATKDPVLLDRRTTVDTEDPVPLDRRTTVDTAGAAPVRTEHGAVLGTPGYMAPEQARGDIDSLDDRTDVFALGAILRFLATGARPGEQVGSNAPFSRPLAAICGRAMAPSPAERYESAEALAADVARFQDGEPPLACPEGMFRKAGRLATRHRVAMLLLLTYIVVRGAVLIFVGR